MPVSIEEVLALLPEIFPGVQEIPLKNIRPNPENPGAPLTDEAIQELADNLAERGLVNPLKIQPDKADPLAGGVKPHPENPRLAVSTVEPLTSEGRPWALSDFNFQILAGERRWRAAGRLNWPTLQAFILNPTAEEAVEITYLDNDVRDRGWFAAYQSIEQLVKANPRLTMRQVGTRLKMDPTRVSQALRLLPLLNPAAKALIVGNSYNSNKGNKGISEAAALRLADLGPGSTLKRGVRKNGDETQGLWPYPAIPPETQDLVRRTLEVAIEQELTEGGVKALVGWVQDGHRPEDYGKGKSQAGAAAPGNEEEGGEEEVKPIPWSDGAKHPEYRQIPVERIRLNRFIAIMYQSYLGLDRKVLSMKATNMAPDISVRNLTADEKAADPEHDYELFDGAHTLKAAQILGWSSLLAQVYDIDAMEGIRLHNFTLRHSIPLTWIENYLWIADRVKEEPEKSAAQWAIEAQEDPELVMRLMPLLKIINEPTVIAIIKSVRKCHEGQVEMGGHRFYPKFVLLLEPLAGFSKDLSKTQELVERVVGLVIENEMYGDDIEALVDWVLAGNDPGEYLVEQD